MLNRPSLWSSPRLFVPTLYFVEGLPNGLVVLVSVVLYKNLGYQNDFITSATSLLYLPWVLKFAWAPLVDMHQTKKWWIVVAQMVLAAIACLIAISLHTPLALAITLTCFGLMALVSATQDIAIDAFYLETLNKIEQSAYVGVRNAFYKISWMFAQGGLVYLAGQLAERASIKDAWSICFAMTAALFAAFALLHKRALHQDQAVRSESEKVDYLEAFKTFFQQSHILPIIIYVAIFRLGDALLLKVAPLFLLDATAKQGLNIGNENFGVLYGSFGTLFLLLGGIVGGILVSKLGLKKTLMPTAIFQNSAILLYYLLAKGIAGSGANVNLLLLGSFNAIEQFAYGLGTAAYTVFLLSTVSERYKAGHYALVTAIMALGVMVPGFFSGNLAMSLGYEQFFLLSFIASIPGMMTILLLPLYRAESDR
jgi:MFS transporter, PAT family, beta-lactamase induction signal transducer AmpG